MRQLTRNQAVNVMVFAVDSSDGRTPKTGLTLTCTLSKNGGAFSSISPTVTERGNGWYSVALTSSHTDTLGDLVLRATASGADDINVLCDVVAVNRRDGTRFGLTALPNTAAGTANGLPITNSANRIEADIVAVLGALQPAVGLAEFGYDVVSNTHPHVRLIDGAITSSKFAPSAITSSVIASNAITAAKIQDGALTALKFAEGAFDAVWSEPSVRSLTDKTGFTLAASALSDVASGVWTYSTRSLTTYNDSSGVTTLLSRIPSTISITDGIVDADIKRINAQSGPTPGLALISAQANADGYLLTAIRSNGLTSSSIQNGAITSAKFASGAIDAAAIATNAITDAKINAGALTAAKFASGAFDAVWSVGTRALTDKTGFGLSSSAISDTASGVWTYPTRSLTQAVSGGGATAQEVWEYTSRTLTAQSDSSGVTTLLSRIPSALTITGGAVTVGTNNDKSGYTLAANAVNTTTLQDGTLTAAKFGSSAITSSVIAANAIGASQIANGAITSAKFASGAIDSAAIASNAITDAKINAGALTAAKFASGAFDAVWSVGTRSLTDKVGFGLSSSALNDTASGVWNWSTRLLTAYNDSSGVTTLLSRIPSALTITGGAVTVGTNNDKTGYTLAANAIGASQIADGAITSAKFASGAITSTVLAANAIGASQIATGAITSAKFASGAIDAAAIANNAITDAKINAGALTAAKFASGAFDAVWSVGTRALTDKTGFTLAASALSDVASGVWNWSTRSLTAYNDSSGVTTLLSRIPSALTITGGAVTVGTNNDKTGYSLAANAVNTTTLQDGTLTAAKFASGAITSTVLAANAIGASQIANGAITSAKFASGAIDAAAIANNAITDAKINAGALTAAKFASGAFDAVWSVGTRALTDKAGFGLSSSAISDTAGGVWTYSTRTLTQSVSSIGSLTAEEVWSYSNRSLTADTSGVTTLLGRLTSDRAAKIDDIDDAVQDLSGLVSSGFDDAPQAVWTYATRSLTDKQNFSLNASGITAVASGVWNFGDRYLSGTVDADIVAIYGATEPAQALSTFGYDIYTNTYPTVLLAANAIGASQIANGAITSAKFASGAIDSAAIASNAITDAKINAGALTAAKFASGAFDAVWSVGTRTLTDKTGFGLSSQALSDMASGVWSHATRTLTSISDSSGVTTLLSRIPSALTITGGAVTVGTNNDKSGYTLAANAIGASQIATGAITSAKFASGAIDAAAIASNAITDAKINAGALTAAKFASGAFDAVWSVGTRALTDKTGFGLSSSAISDTASGVWNWSTRLLTAYNDSSGVTTLLSRIPSALTITGGAVTVGTNNDKTGYTLAANAVNTTSLQDGALTAAKFASGAFDAVWSVGTRSLTDKTGFTLSASALSDVASGVWTHSTRTLTQSVSSIGSLTAEEVWSYSNRALTDKAGFGLSSQALNDMASGVWNWSTRTLTQSVSSIGSLTAEEVWNYGNRSLTDKVGFELSSSAISDTASGVWTHSTRLLTTYSDSSGVTTLLSRIPSALTITGGAVTVGTNNDKSGYTLAANAVNTTTLQDGTLTAAKFGSGAFDAVWSVGTRTLTDKTGFTLAASALTDVASGVWNWSTRSLTAYNDSSGVTTLLSRIPSALTITGGAVTVGTNNDKTGYTLAANAVNTTSLQDGTLTAAKFASGAFDAVWSVGTRSLTDKTGFGLSSSAISDTASGVWTHSTRTLTQSVSSIGSLTAEEVWSYSNRALTDKAGFGLSSQALNDMASGVWNWSTRLLTAYNDSSGVTTLLSRIPSALTITGGAVTVGTNNDKTGYSLSSASLTDASSSVWNYGTRSLTTSVSSITAADVWNYSNRSLTQSVSSITPQQVWEYGSRTLTSDPSGVTTLLSRIPSALTISGGQVSASNAAAPGAAMSLTASALNQIVATLFAAETETGLTYVELMRLITAIMLGISSGNTGGSGNISFRSWDGSKIRVTATVDKYGNRSVMVTRDGS